MFWKGRARLKGATSPSLGIFILLFLAGSLQAVEHFPKNDRKSLHTSILKGIAAEIFIIGGAIGAKRPDLMPRIFKQCCDEPEEAMKEIRIALSKVLNIPDLQLESLPNRITGYAAKILENNLPGDRLGDWDQKLYNAVMIGSFLPGCVLGCEHTPLFWDMLQRRLNKAIDKDSLPLAVQMNLFYNHVLSAESKSNLEVLAKGRFETPVKKLEMPVQKLVTLYKEIATTLLANYEREYGSIAV